MPEVFGRRISLNHPLVIAREEGLVRGGAGGRMRGGSRLEGGAGVVHTHRCCLASCDEGGLAGARCKKRRTNLASSFVWEQKIAVYGLTLGASRLMGWHDKRYGGLLLEKVSKVRGMRPHQGISLGLE